MLQYTSTLTGSFIFNSLYMYYCYSTQKGNYIIILQCTTNIQLCEIKLYYHSTLNFVCCIYLHVLTLKVISGEFI